MDKTTKQQQSKSEYGTMTAKFDANGEYGATSGTNANAAGSQKASKAKYGTLTAKSDANNDYN